MKLTSAVLISTLTLGACTVATAPSHLARLGDDLLVTGGKYSSGGGLTIAADFRQKDGRTFVCGAWAQSVDQSVLTKRAARDVLSKGAVFHGRDRVIYGLKFMHEVAPAADYAGSDAGCRLTERPWSGNEKTQDFTIHIPRHEVFNDIDEFGMGIVVYFKQSGPAAGGS